MRIKVCKQCGTKFISKLKSCPKCKTPAGFSLGFVWVYPVVLLLLIWAGFRKNKPRPKDFTLEEFRRPNQSMQGAGPQQSPPQAQALTGNMPQIPGQGAQISGQGAQNMGQTGQISGQGAQNMGQIGQVSGQGAQSLQNLDPQQLALLQAALSGQNKGQGAQNMGQTGQNVQNLDPHQLAFLQQLVANQGPLQNNGDNNAITQRMGGQGLGLPLNRQGQLRNDGQYNQTGQLPQGNNYGENPLFQGDQLSQGRPSAQDSRPLSQEEIIRRNLATQGKNEATGGAKASINAGIYYNGSHISVDNKDDFPWNGVKLVLILHDNPEWYNHSPSRISPGENYRIPVTSFTGSKGQRYNPWSLKPKTLRIYATLPSGVEIIQDHNL